MINKFSEEVLSKGALELLPQKLSKKWLDCLYQASVEFLVTVIFQEEDEFDSEKFNDVNSMLLLMAENEIVQHQNDYSAAYDIKNRESSEIIENLSCYSMWTIYEVISRNSDLSPESPDLDTIFDRGMLFEIEKKTPQLTEMLNKIIGSAINPEE